MGGKSQIIRDARLRFSVEANEIKRRALLYIARNATLESQVRHRAQLQLHNMEGSTRPGRVSNRCMETGRGRGERGLLCDQDLPRSSAYCILPSSTGIMSQFGLCRVRECMRQNESLETCSGSVLPFCNTVSVPPKGIEW